MPQRERMLPSAIDPSTCATAVNPSPTATVYPPTTAPTATVYPPPTATTPTVTQPPALASGGDASQVPPKTAAAIAAPDHFPRLRRKRRRFSSSLPSLGPVVSSFIKKIEFRAGYYVSFFQSPSPGSRYCDDCASAVGATATATVMPATPAMMASLRFID